MSENLALVPEPHFSRSFDTFEYDDSAPLEEDSASDHSSIPKLEQNFNSFMSESRLEELFAPPERSVSKLTFSNIKQFA